MKLAVIDIGSNAIRLQIVKVFEQNDIVSFKKLEYLRFPLRLGKDVFNKGEISDKTYVKLSKLMQTFKLLIELYEVKNYSAVATSAFREAKNGEKIQNKILEDIGLKIKVISGDTEAKVLNKAIIPYLSEGHNIHIDVGGGSTEINIFKGKELVTSKSFKIGSVRKLDENKRKKTFEGIQKWIIKNSQEGEKNVMGIGTGGNINKLFGLARKSSNQTISLTELRAIRAYVSEFSYEQRMSILKLNPDRADVILPASDIYISALEYIGSDRILVPKVGLKDGLVYELFEELTHKHISQIEFLEEF